jgi:hypothetical protein
MVKKKGENVKKVLITGDAGLVCVQKPEPSRNQSINERKPNYCRLEENSEIPRSRETRLRLLWRRLWQIKGDHPSI